MDRLAAGDAQKMELIVEDGVEIVETSPASLDDVGADLKARVKAELRRRGLV